MSRTQTSRFKKYSSSWWKPEEVGDHIEGTLLSVEEATSQDGEPYPVLVLDTPEEGERKVRAGQYDLKEQLDKKDPADGDWLEIELTGLRQVAKGKQKLFSLVVKRAGPGNFDEEAF